MRERIVSGMRPTGKLHLGHYLGVIQNWVELQHKYDSFFFVADWHALTTKYDSTESLKENTLDVAIDWLASGANVTPNGVKPYAVTPSAAMNCPTGVHIATTSRTVTISK